MKKSLNVPVLFKKMGFGSAHLPCLPWLVQGTSRVYTWGKENKRYDITAEQCF